MKKASVACGFYSHPFPLIFKCLEKMRRKKTLCSFRLPNMNNHDIRPAGAALQPDTSSPSRARPADFSPLEPNPLLAKALHLDVCRLSGDSCVAEDFWRR